MSKKRLLPQYVTSFRDRHGRDRLRFRRVGYPSYYFKSLFGTEAFRVEYRACLDAAPPPEPVERLAVEPGSIADLVQRYVSVPTRLGPSMTTQAKVRAIILKFAKGRETWPVNGVTFEHIDAIIAQRRQKVKVGTRMEGGVEAARKLRKELVRLFAYARKLKMIRENPADDADYVRASKEERSTGYYSWTEDDIDRFRAHWPIGSKQRMMMEILLWTGQRRGDAIRFGPDDVRNGMISVVQDKGGKALTIPLAPLAVEAIVAVEHQPGQKTFLVTSFGKPFSNPGFGNWWREACDAAGLPECTAHGLRKAIMRRMAELEVANPGMKAISGHTKDDEVALYTAAANQKKLARRAIALLSAWEKANRPSGLDTEDGANA